MRCGLDVSGLWVGYGGEPIVRGVSFRAEPGRITALLGRNGAGKSTILRAVAGLLLPARGTVRLDGQEVTGLSPRELIRRGLAFVAQGRECFPDLTVEENLHAALLGLGLPRSGRSDRIGAVLDVFDILRPELRRPVSTLGGGMRQILVAAMGLVQGPRCLVLDEPSLGMAGSIMAILERALRAAADGGATVLLVEQKPRLIFAIGEYAYFLEDGAVALQGPPVELRENPDFVSRYLGLTGQYAGV